MRLSCVPTWAFGMVSDSDGSYQADGRVLDLNCILELLGPNQHIWYEHLKMEGLHTI